MFLVAFLKGLVILHLISLHPSYLYTIPLCFISYQYFLFFHPSLPAHLLFFSLPPLLPSLPSTLPSFFLPMSLPLFSDPCHFPFPLNLPLTSLWIPPFPPPSLALPVSSILSPFPLLFFHFSFSSLPMFIPYS